MSSKAGQGADSLDTVVTEFKGQSELEALELRNVKTGKRLHLPVTGAFIAIGMVPNTAWLGNLLPLDKWGFIVTSRLMEIEIPGIFAAGDVRSKCERQISTAVGDGISGGHRRRKIS